MEQLLLHLIGDYITQTDWMARTKTNKFYAAFIHATIYSLPFILLTQNPLPLFIIWFSHLLIDHFRLARYVVFTKNWLTDRSLKWSDCSGTGYHKDTPPWLATWLLIIADNIIHLVINYSTLRWLNFEACSFHVVIPISIVIGCCIIYAFIKNNPNIGY